MTGNSTDDKKQVPCPHCGAALQVEPRQVVAICGTCHRVVRVDKLLERGGSGTVRGPVSESVLRLGDSIPKTEASPRRPQPPALESASQGPESSLKQADSPAPDEGETAESQQEAAEARQESEADAQPAGGAAEVAESHAGHDKTFGEPDVRPGAPEPADQPHGPTETSIAPQVGSPEAGATSSRPAAGNRAAEMGAAAAKVTVQSASSSELLRSGAVSSSAYARLTCPNCGHFVEFFGKEIAVGKSCPVCGTHISPVANLEALGPRGTLASEVLKQALVTESNPDLRTLTGSANNSTARIVMWLVLGLLAVGAPLVFLMVGSSSRSTIPYPTTTHRGVDLRGGDVSRSVLQGRLRVTAPGTGEREVSFKSCRVWPTAQGYRLEFADRWNQVSVLLESGSENKVMIRGLEGVPGLDAASTTFSDCSTYQVRVKPMPIQVNGRKLYRGDATISCKKDGTIDLKIWVDFSRCRQGS